VLGRASPGWVWGEKVRGARVGGMGVGWGGEGFNGGSVVGCVQVWPVDDGSCKKKIISFVCSVCSACPVCPDCQVRSFMLPGTSMGVADIRLWASRHSFGASVPRV